MSSSENIPVPEVIPEAIEKAFCSSCGCFVLVSKFNNLKCGKRKRTCSKHERVKKEYMKWEDFLETIKTLHIVSSFI